MAISVLEFRALLLADELDRIETELFADGALHISGEDITYIGARLAAAYGVGSSNVRTIVVGSAKLGFAMADKRVRDGSTMPRYRPFGPDSDVDVAVISPIVFDRIWLELARHVNARPWMPHRIGGGRASLGDYLVYGWFRPDKFPIGVRLWACDTWWDTFRTLSAESRFARPVRGGLFYSEEHMKLYYRRAVLDCQRAERELP